MKSKVKRNLFFAIICLVLCITIIVVNYVLDNTNGKGISNKNMSTLREYRRSLTLMIVSLVMATASVGMMAASLFVYMRKKQAEDMEALAKLEQEHSAQGGDEAPADTSQE